MTDTPLIKVRRVRSDDAGAIANFLAQATKGRLVVPYDEVVERLGSKAFFVASADQVVGLAGWRAENLVGRIDDLVIHPVALRSAVGRALFDAIEKEARKLECEVLLLFVPNIASAAAVTFYQSVGFQRRLLHDIPLPWQQAAEDFTAGDHFVMARQLRDLVMKPI